MRRLSLDVLLRDVLLRDVLVSLAVVASLQAAGAQTGQIDPVPAHPARSARPPAKHKQSATQSPLATIMSSRLWTDVPEAKDFVRDSRPATKNLKYTPLTSQLGPDPVRPKPRDTANVMALQAEMEASLAHNAARGGSKPRHAKTEHMD